MSICVSCCESVAAAFRLFPVGISLMQERAASLARPLSVVWSEYMVKGESKVKRFCILLAAAVVLTACSIGVFADGTNLLLNPGFENFAPAQMAGSSADGSWSLHDWTYTVYAPSDLVTVWEDGVWAWYPTQGWGTPTPHSGGRSLACWGNNTSADYARVGFIQKVSLWCPSIVDASVYVRPFSVPGQSGFGVDPGDYVQLSVTELDANNWNYGITYTSEKLTTAGTDYVKLTVPTFTTSPWCAGLEVQLYTQTITGYTEAHVTWDDAFVSATPAPEYVGTVTGIVRDKANPSHVLADAIVKAPSGQTKTDSTGHFSLLIPADTPVTITAYCDDYYAASVDNVQAGAAQQTSANIEMMHLSTPTSIDVVADTFGRADSPALGSTEGANSYPWIAGIVESAASIQGNKMLFGTGSDPAHPVEMSGASVGGGYLPADLDFSVDMTTTGWSGIAYRQQQPGTFDDKNGQPASGAGYLIYNPDSTHLVLYRNAVILASAELPTAVDWSTTHRLRVKAVGAYHQVFLDGVRVIECIDFAKLTGGYATLLRATAESTYDNLSITRYAVYSAVTGTVSEKGNPANTIADALVSTGTNQTRTDSSGHYRLMIPAGTPVTITACHDEYYAGSVSNVQAAVGQTAVADLQLARVPTPSSSDIVTDSFSRGDSSELGTTEGVNAYPWVVGAAEAKASISNSKMLLASGVNFAGVSVGGSYLPADLDFSVSMTLTGWSGIAYRHLKPGTFDDRDGQTAAQAGYLIYVADATHIRLYRNTVVLSVAEFATPIDWSTPHILRVKAIGPYHQVFLDGNRIIECVDFGKLAGGHATLLRATGEATYDSMSITRYARTVAAAKNAQDGAAASCSGAVVTAAFAGAFYVEDADRTAGIKVVSDTLVVVGDVVALEGVAGTDDGEKFITASDVQIIGSTTGIKPLGAPNKAVAAEVGLSDIGLLKTVWGKVKAVSGDQTYCYIDDGSGVSHETGVVGLKVIIAGEKKPVAGTFVSCTGIVRMSAGSVPVLQMRSDDDLVLVP